MPFLDVTRKRTYWSIQIFSGVPFTSMPEKSRFEISPVLLIDVYSRSSSSMLFFDRIFFLTWYMCPFYVATLLGRYLVTSCIVSPVNDEK